MDGSERVFLNIVNSVLEMMYYVNVGGDLLFIMDDFLGMFCIWEFDGFYVFMFMKGYNFSNFFLIILYVSEVGLDVVL